MTLALVLLIALSADGRQELTRAIEEHLAGDFTKALDRYEKVLDRDPDFLPARIYAAEALWLSGQRDDARRALAQATQSSPDLLVIQWLRWHFFEEREGARALVRRLESVYPFERRRFIATGTASLILLSRGEGELAIEDFHRASMLDPEDVRLHRQLGNAFAKAGLPLPATEAFERVVAQAPEETSAWRQLGSSRLLLQRWSSAVEAFTRVRELGGEDVGTLLAKGYAYERLTDFESAHACYRRASRLAPSAYQPHYRMGRAYLVQNDTQRAEESLLKAAELAPDASEPLAFLGELYVKRRDYERAITMLERATEIDEEYFEAYYHLAQAYYRSGRTEDARRAMARYESLKKAERHAPAN